MLSVLCCAFPTYSFEITCICKTHKWLIALHFLDTASDIQVFRQLAVLHDPGQSTTDANDACPLFLARNLTTLKRPGRALFSMG